MIGRGIFHNPFCFGTGAASRTQLLDLLRYHLDLFDQWQPTLKRPFETLKRFFKIYVRDFDGAKELREQLMACQTTDEVRALLPD